MTPIGDPTETRTTGRSRCRCRAADRRRRGEQPVAARQPRLLQGPAGGPGRRHRDGAGQHHRHRGPRRTTEATRTGTERRACPTCSASRAQLPTISRRQPEPGDDTNSTDADGTGEIKRSETVTLRLAGVVTQVLPNGNLVVAARQEVRVNSELRELPGERRGAPAGHRAATTRCSTTGWRRRASRTGGRGQLTDVQPPRYGQQLLDICCRSNLTGGGRAVIPGPARPASGWPQPGPPDGSAPASDSRPAAP